MDNTKTAVEIFDKCAEAYQGKFMDTSLYHDSFDLFCSSIATQHPAILELACGPGNITRYLLEKRPDFQILGTDLSENMLRLARLNNPTAEFKLMDCRDLGMTGKRYDGVMCGFCMPYLSKEDISKLIRDAAGLLNDKGLLYISTMEENAGNSSGFKTSSSGDSMYVHYHLADDLLGALRENGFKIIDLRRKEYPAPDGTLTTDLLIIAGK